MNFSDVQRRVVCSCRQGGLAGADEEKIGQKKELTVAQDLDTRYGVCRPKKSSEDLKLEP